MPHRRWPILRLAALIGGAGAGLASCEKTEPPHPPATVVSDPDAPPPGTQAAEAIGVSAAPQPDEVTRP